MKSNTETADIWVTGANGWLGRSFLKSLLFGIDDLPTLLPYKKLRIRAMHLPGEELPKIPASDIHQLEWFEGDLCKTESVRKFFKRDDSENDSIVFHLAGIIHPKRVADFYRVNRDATVRVAEISESAGIENIVVMSSNSPCGCNPFEEHQFDESSPYNPYMHYGKSKQAMEEALLKFWKTSKQSGVIIRAPWFYGPNQPPRQTTFFEMIRKGRFPVVGNGMNRRSMVHVDNLCQGLIRAAIRKESRKQIYWIADESPYSMNKIIETVGDVLKECGFTVKPNRFKLPGFFGELAWLADYVLQSLGLYHQKIHVLSELNRNISCSVAQAKKDLSYQPTIALKEGMSKSVKWCLDVGHLRLQ